MNLYLYFICFLLFSPLAISHSPSASPEKIVKTVYSHLLVHSEQEALKECARALSIYPTSQPLQRAYIRVLIALGRENEAIAKWRVWGREGVNFDILEELAWAVLHRFAHSRQLGVNIASLMGAFYTQDVRCVQMLKNCMCSSDPFLRAIAVKMASHYQDTVLIEQIKTLFQQEQVWYVRLEAIRALALMHASGMKEPLKKILISSRSSVEEKFCAANAIVDLYDQIDPKEMSELIQSTRAELRYLSCRLIARLDLIDQVPRLVFLLDDPVPKVRIASLTSLYLLGLKYLPTELLAKIQKMMEDPHPTVSITAAQLCIRFSQEKALQTLKKWVYNPHCPLRNVAAFVMGSTSMKGALLAEEIIRISSDWFVKANAALGLMHQNVKTDLAGATLYQFLMICREKIMWKQAPLFQVLSPSLVQNIPHISQYPILIDQTTRLDILHYLSVLEHPQAKGAFKEFLKHQILGVSYAALTSFMQEGGEEALRILRSFLEEKDEQLQLRAALVLALFCKETGAVKILQEAYFSANRETKMNILEAIGRIGDRTSVPFLLDRLEKELHQTLKVLAASSMIQCLYH